MSRFATLSTSPDRGKIDGRAVVATILLAASLALTGCSRPPGDTIAESYEIDDESDRAVVVLGILLDHPPRQVETWVSTFDDSFYAWWVPIDPASGQGVRRRVYMNADRDDCDRPQITANVVPCEPDFQKPQMFVFDVPPGDYALLAVREGDPGEIETRFFEVQPASIVTAVLTGDVDEPPSVFNDEQSSRFHVEPGQVIYVGNYVFDLTGDVEKLVAIDRTDDLAREALALYPGINTEFVYLPVTAKGVAVPPK